MQQLIGKQGEQKAIHFLREQGYEILAQNWRIGHKEVDIVCTDGHFVVIVEVKTRMQPVENPEELLDLKKRRNIIRAGAAYIKRYKIERELRFDLIIVNEKSNTLQHIPEAIRIIDNF